ncbi:MAG: tetratricopeptide repeat protein [Pseudomonas piscis]|uniref:tetratricopeptide repeat protein n=1 Tax=Pseudomonas piscis TaxID=2614538 RepID=UPI003D2BA168
MAFRLRREESLDGGQLSAMLEESPGRAAQAILLAAGEGLVDAQALLGQILLDGRGIEQDQALALRWFGIAAQRGHLMARNMLGRCHEHGWGCPADPGVAAEHYRQAAAAGLDWGLYNYANLLATGRGVPQDHGRALACYRRAAQLGHVKSMNLLGRYLEEGLVCPADPQAARDWYRRSAEGGDFRGQFSHGAILADAGRIDEALDWLQRALAGGNLNFLRVARGALLEARHPEIRQLALAYHQRAAQLGDERDAARLAELAATLDLLPSEGLAEVDADRVVEHQVVQAWAEDLSKDAKV